MNLTAAEFFGDKSAVNRALNSQLLLILILLLSAFCPSLRAQTMADADSSTASSGEKWGEFIGRVSEHKPHPTDPDYLPKWGPDQRVLDQDFGYKDPGAGKWIARKGQHIDGASIPSIFWSYLVGTPFTGHYFEGSVLHDAYCEKPAGHSYLQIHQMFYNAMRCGGTKPFEVGVKYWAVLKFGPPCDRSIFNRIFRKPTKPVGDPESSATAEWLPRQVLPIVDDTARAQFFAGLEIETGLPTIAAEKGDAQAVGYFAPAASLVALASVAAERGMINTVMIDPKWHPDYAASVESPVFSPSEAPRPSPIAAPEPTPVVQYDLKINFAASPYRITNIKLEQDAMNAVIYLAKEYRRLRPKDIEELVRNGVPKEAETSTRPAGH
jgi:Protein of unknown function (DUF1353)